MKRKYTVSILLLCVLLLLLSCGCAASNKEADSSAEIVGNRYDASNEKSGNDDGYFYSSDTAAGSSTTAETASGSSTAKYDASQQKLIRDASITLQTKEYDSLLTNLNTAITECAGYISSSETGGTSYYDEGGCRYANIIARIPAEKLDEFLGKVGTLGKITSETSSVRDVTSEYIDVESHLTALRTEQTSLLALLEKAEALEDIILVQDRLTQVRADIESYEKQRRVFDDLISYSTVTLNIYEVERITTQPDELSAWQQIKENFVYNLRSVAAGLREFFIDFVSALPYIVLWLVIAIVVFFVIKGVVRRQRKKKQKSGKKPRRKKSDELPVSVASEEKKGKKEDE